MKVLHVLDHSIPLHSGYAFRTLSILNHQEEFGIETYHVTGTKQGRCNGDEEVVDGVHFYRTRGWEGLSSEVPGLCQLGVIVSLKQRIDELIGQINPDVLHAHSPALNGMAALLSARKYNIPLVYEVRAFWEDAAVDHGTSIEGGMRYRATRALETHILKQADAVTTICEGLRGDIIERGIEPDKVTVIPNAVNPGQFSSARSGDGASQVLKHRLGLEGCRILGFIGSFYAYEGILLLISALPEISRRLPDVRLLLVGGGPQEAEIRALIDRLGIQDKVIMTGRIPHEAVAEYYQIVDIFVYPRLSMRLTDLVTPLKPLEAMAQEKLVVASDVGGHRELISDQKTGVLFKSGDLQALENAVSGLLDDPQRWPAIKSCARSYVDAERTWKKSVARYDAVYRQARERHG